MIVSHKHRFIFLKTMKTAGTSVEIALSGLCGESDIITPISIRDEALRPSLGAQNYLNSLGGDHRRRRADGLVEPESLLGDFYNHMPAREVLERVGARVWNSYFKWTIERNPWDRQVSLYYYRRRDSAYSFEKHMLEPSAQIRNFEIYSIGSSIAADYVCRYETLHKSVREALSMIGLRLDAPLVRAKSTFRPAGDDYRSYYNDETRSTVGTWYQREIDALGYRY